MSNTYELMFILRPDLSSELVNKQMHKYRNLLKDLGAGKVSMEVWGKRRLAYEINRFQDGIYILTYFTGDGAQVAPLERDMRLSEEIIRYLTLKHDKDIEFEDSELPEVQETVAPPAPVVSSDSPDEEKSEEETETATETEAVTQETTEEDTPVEA